MEATHMKLYGGLINRLGENSKPQVPTVGMGGTIFHYSDRTAVTIVEVSKDGTTIWYTGDTTKRVDANGMSDAQAYEYTTNWDASRGMAKLDKTGRWRIYSPVTEMRSYTEPDGKTGWGWFAVKHAKTGATRYRKTSEIIGVGSRDAYHDYSF
jgi:hypothetical protein